MKIERLAECGVLPADALQIVQQVFDRVRAEPWFSNEVNKEEEFARFVLRTFDLGLTDPSKLYSFCRLAALNRYRQGDQPQSLD
jgi:hypothetical protein